MPTRKFLQSLVTATALTFTAPALSLAAPIFGELDIGGSSGTVAPLFLNFNCNSANTLAPCPAPANYGNFSTTGATNSFAPYNTQGGDIHNLSQATTPLNQTFNLPNFLIFSGTAGNPVIPPDIALDLHFIVLGVDPQATCTAAPTAGQTCTPAFAALVSAANPLGLSAFNLQNTQTGSTASFSVAGTARRISTGETSAFNGVFTAQFTVPYQTVLTQLASGTVTNSYSATFLATPIPEPGTAALILGGAALVVGSRIRRFAPRRRS